MSNNKEENDKIKQYVSNLDKDIYTVNNIPEEVVAVIFAYVSRSMKSFRENISTVIKEEQMGQERASKFHEKWVLNYGHSSVAEHACVHVGVEKVSRLFSSLLELSNEYLSFTEYSQRYQKPVRGGFYTPVEVSSKRSLNKEFQKLSLNTYDLYIDLYNALISYLKKKDPSSDDKVLEKIAFEDARYALNLSTYTNLGITANARAVEDALAVLLSSKYPEVRSRANEIKQEVGFSVPTLIKYASEKGYITKTRGIFERLSDKMCDTSVYNRPSARVNLISWTGDNSDNPQDIALKKIIKAVIFERHDSKYSKVSGLVESLTSEQLTSLFKETVKHLGKHDNPVKAFKLIDYEAELVISEACWHQLLRHRKVNWIFGEPSVYNGITVPPRIKEAGVEELLLKATERSEDMFEKLMNEGLDTAAHYVVTNAHNRRVTGKFDLWELFHLVNLRTSEAAQWDIKTVMQDLMEEIRKYHPVIVEATSSRLNS